MHLNASNITNMGRRIPLASIRNETSGTEQGRTEGGLADGVSRWECWRIVPPSGT